MKLLLILLVVYLGFKFIGKYVFPIVVKRYVGKFEQKMKEQQQAQEPKQKVGETLIDKKPNSDKTSNNDVGEYVDYEDVD